MRDKKVMVPHGRYTLDEIASGRMTFEGSMRPVVAKIKCVDGTELSVQASRTHYCLPREDYGPYSELEVGHPSVEPPGTWREYFDGDWKNNDRCNSVYGYVPVGKIRWFIRSHGGEVVLA